MVQVLPQVPTFGAKLAAVLGGASEKVGEGFIQRRQQQAVQRANAIITDPSKSASEKYAAFSALPKDAQAATSQAFSSFISPKAETEESARRQQEAFGGHGTPGPTSQQPTASGQQNLNTLPTSTLQAVAAAGGSQAKAAEAALKPRAEYQSLQVQAGNEILTQNRARGERLENQAANLGILRSSVSHIKGGFDRDYLANLTGWKPFATGSGAAFNTAAKDLYVESLAGIPGARPNQWIEKYLSNANPEIGKSYYANSAIIEVAQFRHDIEKAKHDAINNLKGFYESQLGYVPPDIEDMANKSIKPFIELRENQLKYELQKLHEQEGGTDSLWKLKHVDKGTPLTIEKGKVLQEKFGKQAEAKAKELGYEIPERGVYQKYLTPK